MPLGRRPRGDRVSAVAAVARVVAASVFGLATAAVLPRAFLQLPQPSPPWLGKFARCAEESQLYIAHRCQLTRSVGRTAQSRGGRGALVIARAKKKKVDPAIVEKRRQAALVREQALKKAEEARRRRAEEEEQQQAAMEAAEAQEEAVAVAEAATEASDGDDGEDIERLTVQQLKRRLAERGLMVSGKKAELVARLRAGQAASGSGAVADAPPMMGCELELNRLTKVQLQARLSERGLPTTGRKAELVARCAALDLAPQINADASADVGTDASSGVADANSAAFARPANVARGFIEGDRVEAKFADDGEWYPGLVKRVGATGVVTVVWDEDQQEVDLDAKDVKLTLDRVLIAQLKVGQKLRGTVQRTTPIGAFVDVGASRNGLVRRTRMANEHVANTQDVVQRGDVVDVWVYRVPSNGQLGLSMVECRPSPLQDPVVAFDGIGRSHWFDGVVRFEGPYGYYVDVEAPGEGAGGRVQGWLRAGLAVGKPEPGTAVNVRVLQVQADSGMLQLSMRPPPPPRR
mmetsp:Transcript_85641/g.239220  ORF Transcript_85641/g.239220 Transcript_85641/m.239220 type:complete len:520 (+) Transcript_85641:123-1682(+)